MTKLIKRLSDPKVLLFVSLLYTVFITIVFVIPGKELPQPELPIDKLAHVILLLCLAVIWLMYFYSRNYLSLSVKTTVLILVGCFIYGIVIEIIQQRFIDYRHADIWDVAANTTGLILGFLVFRKAKQFLES